jgi:hypothetical protein
MATEKLKTNTRFKNTTWSNPQNKKHKEPRIHTDQTIHTTQIPDNKYVKFLKPLTQSVEQIVNLLHGFI